VNPPSGIGAAVIAPTAPICTVLPFGILSDVNKLGTISKLGSIASRTINCTTVGMTINLYTLRRRILVKGLDHIFIHTMWSTAYDL
jgi:hypothetical protein